MRRWPPKALVCGCACLNITDSGEIESTKGRSAIFCRGWQSRLPLSRRCARHCVSRREKPPGRPRETPRTQSADCLRKSNDTWRAPTRTLTDLTVVFERELSWKGGSRRTIIHTCFSNSSLREDQRLRQLAALLCHEGPKSSADWTLPCSTGGRGGGQNLECQEQVMRYVRGQRVPARAALAGSEAA
jgi:hypothetical protein